MEAASPYSQFLQDFSIHQPFAWDFAPASGYVNSLRTWMAAGL